MLLKPETPQQVSAKLKTAQCKQANYCNRKAKTLVPLKSSDPVYMKVPGSTTWSPEIWLHRAHIWWNARETHTVAIADT